MHHHHDSDEEKLIHQPDGDATTAAALHRGDPGILGVRLDRASSIPAFQQLKFHLIHAISTSRLIPGDVMPSVREASEKLEVAPATIQRAYNELKNERYLDSRPGHSVYVADIETPARLSGDQGTSLSDLLMPVYVTTRSMGFSDVEILETIEGLTETSSAVYAPRVAFIGPGQRAVEKYSAILADSLAPMDVEVVGFTVDQMRSNHELLRSPNRPYALLVTVVSCLADVRDIGMQHSIPTCGLLMELTETTKRMLAQLPFGSKVGLISEPKYLSNSESLIEQLCGDGVEVFGVVSAEPGTTDVLAACDAIFYTFTASDLARALLPEGALATEFAFQALRASLDHVAELVRGSSGGSHNINNSPDRSPQC